MSIPGDVREMTKVCSHPTCYESDESTTMYKEPTDHNERGWFPVCGQHVDLSKDNITVLMTENSGAAQVANAEILSGIKKNQS